MPLPASALADTLLCLCGDVMSGHGIDPLLPPDVPAEADRGVRAALDYVRDAVNARDLAPSVPPLPRPVCFDYPWGDALPLLRRERPDLRLVNLGLPITARDCPARGRHARLHPLQLPALAALGADGAVLACRHVLDWGREGLSDTLDSLRQAGIAGVGAGRNLAEAEQEGQWRLPGKARVRLFAFGHASSGLSPDWAAGEGAPGICWLQPPEARAVARLARRIEEAREEGDVVVVALHWGGHWGYEIPEEQRRLAHALIDEAGVDLVWGHASHHPRPIEVHHGRLILYGVGDFLKDVACAAGHEHFRPELAALYLPRLAADGRLEELRLWPLRVHLFRLKRACATESQWLADCLGRTGVELGTALAPQPDGSLRLQWQ